MSDPLDLIPLVQETAASIRARLDADANAGVLATDEDYIDTVEGNAYWDVTQPPALEAERLWDFLATEVVAAMFVQMAWGQYLDEHGEMLGVPRKDEVKAAGEVTFAGTDGTFVGTGTQLAQGALDPDSDPVTFATTASGTISGGVLDLPAAAVDAGPEGNVAAGQITFVLTPIDGIASVTNADAMTGGTEVESDNDYQARLLLEWRAPGAAGNVSDYERWALAYPGVGDVTVTPAWAGVNTVRVVVTDSDGDPVPTAVTDGLKALLDPGDGLGAGLAPIGATVTVATVTAVTVPVGASVHSEAGYSLTGAGGTIAIGDTIKTVIGDYINGLHPGEDVVRAKVESLFFRVDGVADVTSVTLNALPANFAVSDTQVAAVTMGAITLGSF